jgi:hypothetical protein
MQVNITDFIVVLGGKFSGFVWTHFPLLFQVPLLIERHTYDSRKYK